MISYIYRSNSPYIWQAGSFDNNSFKKASTLALQNQANEANVSQMIDWIQLHPGRMNTWEAKFFESIKSVVRLSRKQRVVLLKIYRKCSDVQCTANATLSGARAHTEGR
jgi:hypothetical protein